MSLLNMIDGMIEQLNTAKLDAEKFEAGNNAAGTRARKALQDVRLASQDARKAIQEKKNASK